VAALGPKVMLVHLPCFDAPCRWKEAASWKLPPWRVAVIPSLGQIIGPMDREMKHKSEQNEGGHIRYGMNCVKQQHKSCGFIFFVD